MRPFIAVLFTVALLGLTISGGAMAQTDIAKWNLNVSSEIGESPDADIVSDHQNVNVSFQRTSPSGSNDIIFLPTIDSYTRENAEVTLTLRHTPSGDSTTKTVDIESGDQVNQTALTHERTSGGSISEGEYEIDVSVTDSSNEEVASKTVTISGFYVQEAEISDTPDIGGSDNSTATIIPGGSEVSVSEVISDVTRYNDGTSEISELQDPSIPPLVENNTSTFDRGIGEFKSFDSMREREEPTLNDATVSSVSLDGDHLINVGTATYGIPEANHHRLILTYSMQTMNPTDRGVGIEIVTGEGEVIDSDKRLENLDSSSPRWLSDTVMADVDRTKLEQLSNADEDILDESSVSIQLTDEEEAYINNNYEAYIIYRTPQAGSPGGLTIFKPFRAAIYSTDEQDVDFTYRPEHPETGDTVQLSLTKLPEEFQAEDDELGTIEWEIEKDGDTITREQEITQSEYTDLLTNPDTTIEGPTTTYATAGSKKVTVTVDPPADSERQRTKRIDVIGESGSLEDTPATFDVSYKVLNEVNSVYGSVDVAPTQGIESMDQRARIEVTVKNDGRSQIQREVALLDTMEGEFGYTRQVKDTATVTVPPQSTAKARLSTDWPAEDYGEHDIFVVEYKDGSPQEIPREATGNYKTSVYVEQPATLEITDIISPNAHLVYDNFTASVELENVGDLGTEHPASDVELIGRFGDSWEGVGEIGDIAGGKVRNDTPGETKQITFTRDGLDYSPNYPGITLAQREEVNSPWDTTVGATELSFHTRHHFADDNTARFKELNDDQKTLVELYRMRILYIAENSDDPQIWATDEEAPTFEASAYKFTGPHYTSDNTKNASDFPNVQQDGAEWPSNAMPTTNITQFEQPTKGDTSHQRDISIRVGLDNIETARTGTARVKVVSDRKVYYPEDWSTQHPEDNRSEYKWFPQAGTDPESAQTTDGYSNRVVGTASVDLTDWQTLDGEQGNAPGIEVPIVIPNHEENQGIHTLTVMVRHKPDYIQTYDEGTISQFEYKVDITVWGDSVYLGYTNNRQGDQYEHEVFQDAQWTTVGLGQYKGSGPTTTDIDMTYKNVGGAPLQQTIDAHFWHTQPDDLVNNTSDINDHHKEIADARAIDQRLLTSDGPYGSTAYADANPQQHQYYWAQNITQTLAPTGQPQSDRYQTWTFAHEFTEPGKYILHPTQYRVTEDENRFEMYHDVGIENDRSKEFGAQSDIMAGEDRVTIMVWDDIKPVSRFHPQDCTDGSGTSTTGVSYNGCLGGEYNGLSSFTSDDGSYSGVVWEGGAIRLDSEQRERWTPEQAQNYDVSSDNVGVDHYNWNISPNRIGSSTSPAFVHRFNDSGYHTIENTVRDHDEYVDGAGEDNQDTHTENIYVQPDNDAPYININPLSCSNYDPGTYLHGYAAADTCWNGDYVWSSGPHTSGADISWGAYTDEGQIGVESVNWSTDYGGSNINSTGNFDGSTDNPYTNNNVGPTETGWHYSTDQGSFSHRSSGGDVYQPVTVTMEATDFAGNTSSDSESFTVVTDNTNPTSSCTPSSCYNEDFDNGNYAEDTTGSSASATATGSASATTCVTFDEHGPNGGIGFADWSSSGDSVSLEQFSDGTVEVCITASAYASATASASASADASCSVSCDSDPACGTTSTDSCSDYDSDSASDSAYDSDTDDVSATVTVTDYHGNSESRTISAYAEADAEAYAYAFDDDYVDKSCSVDGGTCEDDGGGGCFIATEEVKTPDGSTPISELEAGDEVVSYDEETGEMTTSTIGEVIVHDKEDLDYETSPLMTLKVKLDDGTVTTTQVTANHPYFVQHHPSEDVMDVWTQIGDVPEGSRVKTSQGYGTVIESTEMDKVPDKVYNLHMSDGPHNYVVGGAVVHNANLKY